MVGIFKRSGLISRDQIAPVLGGIYNRDMRANKRYWIWDDHAA